MPEGRRNERSPTTQPCQLPCQLPAACSWTYQCMLSHQLPCHRPHLQCWTYWRRLSHQLPCHRPHVPCWTCQRLLSTSSLATHGARTRTCWRSLGKRHVATTETKTGSTVLEPKRLRKLNLRDKHRPYCICGNLVWKLNATPQPPTPTNTNTDERQHFCFGFPNPGTSEICIQVQVFPNVFNVRFSPSINSSTCRNEILLSSWSVNMTSFRYPLNFRPLFKNDSDHQKQCLDKDMLTRTC